MFGQESDIKKLVAFGYHHDELSFLIASVGDTNQMRMYSDGIQTICGVFYKTFPSSYFSFKSFLCFRFFFKKLSEKNHQQLQSLFNHK
jgi:hypothetical protein